MALAALVALAWARPTLAQAPSGATSQPGGSLREPSSSGAKQSPSRADAIANMKGDLRRLVSANEVYHVKNKKYSSDLSALPGFRSSPGVSVSVLGASADGWSAKATSSALPGKSCVIAVGAVSSPPKTEAEQLSGPDAVAVCDRP